MLCAKFLEDSSSKVDAMDERDILRFHWRMDIGWIVCIEMTHGLIRDHV